MIKQTMKRFHKVGVIPLLLVALMGGVIAPAYAASSPSLGFAGTFGVLSSTFSNTGATLINGDLGYTTASGLGTTTVTGTTHVADGTYAQAGLDQATALGILNANVCTFTFAAGAIDLATDTTHGLLGVYTPGVYCISGAASVGTAGITLNGSGTYIFRVNGAALNTVANSIVTLAGGACASDVFWTPGGATTLGANSTFVGNVIDVPGITTGGIVAWTGRALAFGGTVTTAGLTITVPVCAPTTANLTLVKTVTNTNGGVALPTAWTLTATGPTNISGVTGTPPVTNAAVNVGSYLLGESGGPAGYTPSTYSCVKNTLPPVVSNTIALAAGDTATCTINNHDNPASPAHLTLVKTVTNNNGGIALATAWTLTATGPTNISGVTGSAPVTNATVNVGSYTLGENSGPAGYTTAATYSCVKNALPPVLSNSIALAAGDTATCTINNDDNPPSLTLIKTVNGSASPSAWTLQATGTGGTPTNLSGTTPVISGVTFRADTYALSETGGPAGYTPSQFSCVKNGAGPVLGNSITLAIGDTGVCTINNSFAASASIPTMTEWGMMIMSLLLGATAIFRLRRKRNA